MRSLFTMGLLASVAFAPADMGGDAPAPFDLSTFLGSVQSGEGEIPDGMGASRKSWGWDKLDVSDFVLVSLDDAASALSSANSFGKGTKGRGDKPAREPRDFASRTVYLNPTNGDVATEQSETFSMKVKEIRRIS